jgi:hypothetical protein
MRTRPLLLACILLITGSAHGALKALEQAYELSLSAVTLPASSAGQLIFRRCPACKPESLRVTADTRYFVRPSTVAVSLGDARKAAAAARPAASLYVFYDPNTRGVRRLVLDPGP